MKIIAITRPDFFEGETLQVNALFTQGMERLHLRKPGATKEQLTEWIEQIAPPFRQRIVMHDHHELVRTMHLGGIHLNSRNPEPPAWFLEESPRPTLSRSCHSLVEVEQYRDHCDYLFLSPIYPSISKQGYGPAITREALISARHLLKDKVIALGGISASKLPELSAIGFAGAAVLGALWEKGEKFW